MSLSRGVDLFNAGRYWDAHEAWEEVWMPDRHGPERGFLKGLIQVAAGCLHYTRQNRRGALSKWRSGADFLRAYPAIHQGVATAELVADVDRLLIGLAALHEGGDWPALNMPRIRLTSGRGETAGRPPPR